MSPIEAVNYWTESALDDWEVSQSLFVSKKYNHSLFFLQLALEKLIKAIHIKTKDEHPLYIHNLVLLAQKASITLDPTQSEELKEISSFNVSARYDTYKRDFYKKATQEFASLWIANGTKIRNYFLSIIDQ